MLVMGVASPYWMHAINEGVSSLANSSTQTVTSAAMAEKR
jgi:hypothetical protein